MNAYDIGDLILIEATIAVAGAPADPTTLTLSVRDASGAETVYVYGTDVELVRDSQGSYHLDYPATVHGRGTYAWLGTGAATFGEQGAFYVRRTPAFCLVADLAAFLQISIAVDNDPANRAISEASAAIRNYTRQAIEAVTDETITLDCAGGARLFLPELPVTDIDEVIEDGETLVATDDYKLGRHGILHRIGATWAVGIQVIEITYSHGYAAIPQTIVDVCTRAAARSYQAGLKTAAVSGVPGVQGLGLGDYNVTYASEGASGTPNMLGASGAPILLPSERAMLNEYRVKRP